MALWESYLGGNYELVERVKETEEGFVAFVYDKRAKRLAVMKQRPLASMELYRSLQELASPHIPEIYWLIPRDGSLLVVEEHIDGETLEDVLAYGERGSMDEARAADILEQLCECLQPLHERGIVHRDLKPSNIMLAKDRTVKLIDFGIARTQKAEGAADTESLGTRGYAPPEQYGFGQTDARSDIYSLGITIGRLLGEGYRGYLNDVLPTCTALDPGHRYPSVAALRQALPAAQRRWRRKRRIALAASLCAVLLLCALAAWHPETGVEAPPVAAPAETAPDASAPDASPKDSPAKEQAGEGTQQAASVALPVPTPSLPSAAPAAVREAAPEPAPVPLDRRSLHCELALNRTPFRNTTILVSPDVWSAWETGGQVCPFPSHWTVQLHVENRSSQEWVSPRLAVSYDAGEASSAREISVPSLPAGQSVDLEIPLSPCFFAPSQRMCWVNVSLDSPATGPVFRKSLRFDMVKDAETFRQMLGDTYLTAVAEGDAVIVK